MNNDLISREYIIVKLDAELMDISDYLNIHERIKNIIYNAPTAEPETASCGKWKHKDGINYYFCNVCGSGNNNGGGIKTRFCPNCGAKMETWGET